MTSLRERELATIPTATRTYRMEWMFGSIGALAAAIGTWLYYGPADGNLTLFFWDWEVSQLHEAWPFSLMIGGGLLLALAFGMLATKLYRRDEAFTTFVVSSSVMALATLAGAVTYLLIWIL